MLVVMSPRCTPEDIANVEELLNLNGAIEKNDWLRQARDQITAADAAAAPAEEAAADKAK